MKTPRLVTALALAGLLASGPALAGCSSSSGTSKHGTGTTSASTTAVDPSALAGQLDSALDALTSAHLEIDAGALGGQSSADVALKDGHATATDVHLSANGQPVELITIGDTSYAKLPTAAEPGKPWTKFAAGTSPSIPGLGSGLTVTSLASSLSVVTGLVKSSSDLTNAGTAQVGGVTTTHYTMKLNPKAGTGNSQLDSLLGLLGSTQIPVDVWLDAQHRPVRFTIQVSVGGAGFPITVQVSKFDAPVSISPPPAAQVATS